MVNGFESSFIGYRRESDNAAMAATRCSLKARIMIGFEWMSVGESSDCANVLRLFFLLHTLPYPQGNSRSDCNRTINRAHQRKSLDKIIGYHYTWHTLRNAKEVVCFCG